jgi:vitamin B12 transporter
VVVTADREPEPISRTGSSISVVKGETLATSNPGSLVDALRTVPGLDISESGGPGSTTNIRLRGANTGQTLVMIDGIRINDPDRRERRFRFRDVCAERHRADRGAERPAKRALRLGRDGRRRQHHHQEGLGSGAVQRPDRSRKLRHRGHQRIGDGIVGSVVVCGHWRRAAQQRLLPLRLSDPALEAKYGPLERDGFDRVGGSARFGYDAGEGVRLEAGTLSSFTRSAYDQSTGTFPDTPSSATRQLDQVWGRASVDTFGGILTHSLNVFDTHIDRSFNDVTYKTNTLPQNTTSIVSGFVGNSTGAEYQGNLKLGPLGSLIVGSRTQHETANTYSTNLLPKPGPTIALIGKAQDTNSVFALWQLPIGERLNITLGGRVDDVVDVARFETWRATAAYTIAETGTKFHTSAGHRRQGTNVVSTLRSANGTPTLSPSRASATTRASINRCLAAA